MFTAQIESTEAGKVALAINFTSIYSQSECLDMQLFDSESEASAYYYGSAVDYLIRVTYSFIEHKERIQKDYFSTLVHRPHYLQSTVPHKIAGQSSPHISNWCEAYWKILDLKGELNHLLYSPDKSATFKPTPYELAIIIQPYMDQLKALIPHYEKFGHAVAMDQFKTIEKLTKKLVEKAA